MHRSTPTLFSLASLPVLLFAACADTEAATPNPRASATAEKYADAPLAAWRVALLQEAFDAATAMPVSPHIKNRSRAQASVVTAALELEQPRFAERSIPRIDNWRRGACWADLAFLCAQRGWRDEAEKHLELAKQGLENSDANSQEWRRDEIRAKVAKTYLLLGETDEAARYASDLVESEVGEVATVRASLAKPETVEAQIAAVDAIARAGDFDQVHNTLRGCVELYDLTYSDAVLREKVEAAIKSSWTKIPPAIRLDLLAELAERSLAHADQAKALKLAEEARALVASVKWTPEDEVPLAARFAALRFRAGEEAAGREEAAAAVALYDSKREEIVHIQRADALRPIAAAYAAMGDLATSHATFARAVEESMVCPNAWPRTEDYVAICTALAVNGVQPDAALAAHLAEVRAALAGPW